MSDNKDQAAIFNLMRQLARKMQEYDESLKRDEIFEIRKEIRNQIKRLEEKISAVKEKKT